MSGSKLVDGLGRQVGRRRFISHLGKAGFVLASLIALERPGRAAAATTAGMGSAARRAPGRAALRQVYCCSLQYPSDCPNRPNCFLLPAGENWWEWTCCDNHSRYGCFECYAFGCSRALYAGGC
jgi:hypothetical protein